MMSGDTQLAEFTISGIITTVGSSGNSGPGGGGFGPGYGVKFVSADPAEETE